jgi:hypothetical protein
MLHDTQFRGIGEPLRLIVDEVEAPNHTACANDGRLDGCPLFQIIRSLDAVIHAERSVEAMPPMARRPTAMPSSRGRSGRVALA